MKFFRIPRVEGFLGGQFGGKKVPRKISFFNWTAMWEKILTTDNLK